MCLLSLHESIGFTHRKKGYRNSTHGVLLLQKAPLCRWGAKTVPLGAPNYGQPNSTLRGAVSAPFFLSVDARPLQC